MRKKILITVSLLAMVLITNSCLKDNVGLDWTSSLKGKMYAEVWKGGKSTLALASVPDSVIFKFLVNIASDQPPTQDITVTLAVNDSARAQYNRANGTSFKLYPYIEILEPNLVIKAGTRNAYAHVRIWNANQLNACDNFMAPISIMSATGGVIVADPLNQGSRLMTLPISNPYAADYHVVGYRLHPSLGFFDVDQTETASTIDCQTIIKSGFGDYPYDVQIKVTTDPITVLGVQCFKLICTVLDPATGSPVDSGQGQYDTFTGDATHNPIPPSNDVNYYNPVTKQFVLNLYYNSSANRKMYEIMTRE